MGRASAARSNPSIHRLSSEVASTLRRRRAGIDETMDALNHFATCSLDFRC